MPAVQAPALWLSVAATAVSAVAIGAMVISGGPPRPLTFAGAVLLPADHDSASPAASQTAQPKRPSTPRAEPQASATPTATPSIASYPAPVVVGLSAQNYPSSTFTPRTPPAPTVAARTPADRPTRTSPSGVPPSPTDRSSALAQTLLTALNAAREQAGLTPLSWSANLQRSAAGHNLAMARANQLTSRVGDEPALGVRQANQGVAAGYAAESSICAQSTSLGAALAMQQLILAEQPPADSRRQNLLSGAVSAVGIDILLDPAHGRVWLTEDFAQLPLTTGDA